MFSARFSGLYTSGWWKRSGEFIPKRLYTTYVLDYHMISRGILGHGKHLTQSELSAAYKIFFGTLVSAPRLKIIDLLRKGSHNVSEIQKKLNMDQTALSHNLARLKRCGFVSVTKRNKYRYYQLNDLTIRPLMRIIQKHMGRYCVHILHKQKEVTL